MKLIIVFVLGLFISGCSSVKYVTVPLSKPPEIYNPNKIYTEKDFLKEYKRSLIKISEWQNWYNIQVGSNYFLQIVR